MSSILVHKHVAYVSMITDIRLPPGIHASLESVLVSAAVLSSSVFQFSLEREVVALESADERGARAFFAHVVQGPI